MNVVAADFNGDTFADVAVAPDHPTTSGTVAPEVVVFSGAPWTAGSVLARFLGLNDPHGKGGRRRPELQGRAAARRPGT
jgi:hypothetical protein